MFWNFVTDFGDAAVTLPLAALCIAFLLVSKWYRAALALTLALAACIIAIGLAKIALRSCGQPLLHTDMTSPSGHAALSTTVYGAIALLFGARWPSARRWILLAGAAALVGAIALSRIVLGNHSPVEVAIGLAIGSAALLLFGRLLGAAPALAIHVRWLALLAILVIAGMHGGRWPIEEVARSLALLVRHSVSRCA
jgi:membrane-associated phospholipid phosphatase